MRIIINNGQGQGLSISMYWMHKVFSEIFRDFPRFFGSCKEVARSWKLQVLQGTRKLHGNCKELGKLPGDLGKWKGNLGKGYGMFPGLVSNVP